MPSLLLPILRTFWEICLLRLGPQDLPASPLLAALATAAYLLVGWLLGLVRLPAGQAFLASLLDTLLLAVLARIVLWVRDLGRRFLQTYTALAGSGAVLGLVILPVLLWEGRGGTGEAAALLPLLLLAWTVWGLVVMAHILRHALGIRFVTAVGLSLVYLYLALRVVRAVLGPAA
ncbi:MAG: hypothetical protein D6809_05350 [Gammaproteobacteria bacterium]|nr:MAG: hypothetical protein D6809_05350 [Gammaproteobacteria bacterium]